MRFLAIALLAALPSAALADATYHYVILFEGKPGGSQVTTVRDDGRVVSDFTYRQNGRGPDIHEEIRLDADGLLAEFRVKGKSTFGAPINESFDKKGDRASWRALSDRGSTTIEGPALYAPVDNSLEYVAIGVRAALRQPDHKIALLPGGEARVEALRSVTLDAGGNSSDLTLYAISGADMEPVFVWLTSDDSKRLAAYIYPGSIQVVADALESQVSRLEAEQKQAETDLQAELQKRLAHHFPEPIVFRNVRVFDAAASRLTEPADVYVNRGQIAAIYPANSTLREAGTVIDGDGRTLMSALFDLHVHAGAWDSLQQIAAGVTVTRDMGNNNATLTELRNRIDSGAIVGPTIIPTGFIEGESEFSARGGFVVDSLEAAKDAVDWYAQHGYRQIKIYNSFHPEWVKETAAYAHLRGMRVSGHIPAFTKAEEAVRQGYDEIQHINQVLLNFYVTPTTDTRTLDRFYLIANNVHSLDLDSKAVQDFIALLKEHETSIDLTLATFEPSFMQLQGEENPAFGKIADHLPAATQRALRSNSMDATPKNIATWRASYAKMVEFAGRLYQAGVPIVAGTDDIAGFTLHRELEIYAQAGIPPAEVLKIATVNGAKYTGTSAERGTVERGKVADLMLVNGDPTSNISDIRKVSLVMKGGAVYYPAEIYEAIGVRRFEDPPQVTPAN
jgi:cytosine/adenosine deaminase-related metal-dependent hydrolase